MNTQYRKNLKDVATACKNYTDKRFDDFKWELGTHTIDTTTDSDVAYQKQAPNGTIGCQINSVGGMSYKSENLIVLNDVAETTVSGITYKVENGIIKLNGTCNDDNTFIQIPINPYTTLNAQYYTFALFNNVSNTTILGIRLGSGSTTVNDLQLTNTQLGTTNAYITKQMQSMAEINTLIIRCNTSTTLTNFTIKPMLVEGSTAPTTFKQGFEGIRDSAVTSIVANSTLNIPASIQALAGYGWGINDTCYNYIDFNTKKFVQKVGRIALNDLNVNSWVKTGSNNIVNNGLTPLGKARSLNVINTSTATMAIGGNTNQLVILSTSYLNGTLIADLDLSDFKTYIANNTIYVYYELATPVETDISSYITDNDKFLEVEALGTITFTNTYEQEVPSEITYLTEVAK